MQLLHYTSWAVSLLPCFEGLAVAAPLQAYRSDSYAIHPQTTNSPSSGKLISSWKVTSVLQLWDTKKDDHETIPKHHNIHDQHLEITTTITPSPCHHKGPLQCSSSTPNPAAYKYRYKFRAPAVRFPSLSSSSSSSETDSSRSPSSQSLFHSKNDIERILAPVGILVIMVWLGFVAVVLVAAIDYVWMRWGRGFTGYETITTTTTAEGVGLGIIEEGRGDGSGGVKSGLSDIPEDDEQVEEHGMV